MPEFYDILSVPDPILKQKARMIENIDMALKEQINIMIDTMYSGSGIGLAANQVGKLNRVFVMDLPEDSWQFGEKIDGLLTIETSYRSGKKEEGLKLNPLVLINPEVIWESEERSIYDEGCLSLPKQYGEVIRPAQVCVKFLDIEGKAHETVFEGLDSHCVQHEIDHLDGILFTDHLSSLKRNMILRRLRKIKKETQVL